MSKVKKVGRGLLWMLTPIGAVDNLRGAGGALNRTFRMLRRTSDELPEDADAATKAKVEEERAGRVIFSNADAHARFEFLLTVHPEQAADIPRRRQALLRAHCIRLLMFWVAIGFLPLLAIRYGFASWFYDLALCLMLIVGLIRDTAYVTQLDERALWKFQDVVRRRDFWVRVFLF